MTCTGRGKEAVHPLGGNLPLVELALDCAQAPAVGRSLAGHDVDPDVLAVPQGRPVGPFTPEPHLLEALLPVLAGMRSKHRLHQPLEPPTLHHRVRVVGGQLPQNLVQMTHRTTSGLRGRAEGRR